MDFPDEINLKTTVFNRNNYASERAEYYYQQALNLNRDSKRMAFYCLYITQCENDRKEYSEFIKHLKNKRDNYYSYEYKNDRLIFVDKLRQKKGDENFYKLLIKECSLYFVFKHNI